VLIKLETNFKYLSELTANELFSIFYLRCLVFVVEQNCPYQDIDDKDLTAFHVYGKLGQQVIAVCRILPAGISYSEISIGRVAVSIEYRGTNVANDLMHQTLHFIENKWGTQDIRISAQHHLTSFYSRFDFIQVSEIYLEDDIPHVEMLRTAKNH
jgi:ElaA protein